MTAHVRVACMCWIRDRVLGPYLESMKTEFGPGGSDETCLATCVDGWRDLLMLFAQLDLKITATDDLHFRNATQLRTTKKSNFRTTSKIRTAEKSSFRTTPFFRTAEKSSFRTTHFSEPPKSRVSEPHIFSEPPNPNKELSEFRPNQPVRIRFSLTLSRGPKYSLGSSQCMSATTFPG